MKNLQHIRESHGLTRAELAYKIGTTRQSIRNWELQLTQPSYMVAMITAKVLNVEVAELYGEV